MPYPGKLKKAAEKEKVTITELVRRAIEAANGNEFQAAISLGVYPSALRYWREDRPKKIQTEQN